MKTELIIVIALFIAACGNNANQQDEHVIYFDTGFSLYQDTIQVNIKGDMTHALKHQGKFYVLFEQRILKYGGYGKRWLYVFFNGQIEKELELPSVFKDSYLDFFVYDGKIFLYNYYEKKCYTLDLNDYVWDLTEKPDDLIYEDEFYSVFSLDYGDWGGKTWFRNKSTGKEYIIEATCPSVHKIGTTYYLTTSFRVLKIEDPTELYQCDNENSRENKPSAGQLPSWYGKSVGFNVLYEDTFQRNFHEADKSRIVSSFVLKNELHHIYLTDTAVYVAKINNKSIEPIQKIAGRIEFFKWFHSRRCNDSFKLNQLLTFTTEINNVFGIMDIIDNKILIRYFNNKAELEPISSGAEKADSIFVSRLKIAILDLGNLNIQMIDAKEQQWGGLDITPNHRIGISESYYPNPNGYNLDTCKSYLIQEDSLISNSVIYYSTKANGLIRVVSIDWTRTDVFGLTHEEKLDKALLRKSLVIEEIITRLVGSPYSVVRKKNHTQKTWNTNDGVTIKLKTTQPYRMIRMIIYKN